MDESNFKIVMMNGNYWTHIIFMSNFIQKKNVKGESQRNYITMQKGEMKSRSKSRVGCPHNDGMKKCLKN
jgi:hypothetical protein